MRLVPTPVVEAALPQAQHFTSSEPVCFGTFVGVLPMLSETSSLASHPRVGRSADPTALRFKLLGTLVFCYVILHRLLLALLLHIGTGT